MHITCKTCGDLLEPWQIEMQIGGIKLFGNSDEIGQCFDCFLIDNPPGSEPEWCKVLEELGCLDFLNTP